MKFLGEKQQVIDGFKDSGPVTTLKNDSLVIEISGSEKKANSGIDISEGVEDFSFLVQDENFNSIHGCILPYVWDLVNRKIKPFSGFRFRHIQHKVKRTDYLHF